MALFKSPDERPLGVKLLVSGKHQSDGVSLSSPNYAIGPTYGIQKRFNPLYLTINAGPNYYFSLDSYNSGHNKGLYGSVEISLSYEF